MTLRMLDTFSGIAGMSLAASWTGRIETVGFVEIDPFCRQVIAKNFPGVWIHDDIRTLTGELVRERCGRVDIVCGGFPCQPFSYAGKRRGKGDDRYLWPEMRRVVAGVRPGWVVVENVVGLVGVALDEVLSDLEAEGYSARAFDIPACGAGADHRRERVWIVAHADGQQISDVRHTRGAQGGKEAPPARALDALDGHSGDGLRGGWLPQPGVRRVVDGLPHRVDRITAVGNAVDPRAVYPIFEAIARLEAGRCA